MPRTLLALLLACTVLCPVGVGAADPEAPWWELNDLEGELHCSEDWNGSWVLLKMSTTQCPNCTAQLHELGNIEPRLEQLGVQVIDVYLRGDRRDVRKYLDKNDFRFQPTTLYDWRGVLIQAFRPTMVPHLVLISPDNRIVWQGTYTPGDKLLDLLESKTGAVAASDPSLDAGD